MKKKHQIRKPSIIEFINSLRVLVWKIRFGFTILLFSFLFFFTFCPPSLIWIFLDGRLTLAGSNQVEWRWSTVYLELFRNQISPRIRTFGERRKILGRESKVANPQIQFKWINNNRLNTNEEAIGWLKKGKKKSNKNTW